MKRTPRNFALHALVLIPVGLMSWTFHSPAGLFLGDDLFLNGIFFVVMCVVAGWIYWTNADEDEVADQGGFLNENIRAKGLILLVWASCLFAIDYFALFDHDIWLRLVEPVERMHYEAAAVLVGFGMMLFGDETASDGQTLRL